MNKDITIDDDDIPIPRQNINTAFNKILNRRISRRKLLTNTGLLSANLVVGTNSGASNTNALGAAASFKELPHGLDDKLHVADDYIYQVVVKWGEPIFAEAPSFDVYHQSSDAQNRQFGFNNDFVDYLPIGM